MKLIYILSLGHSGSTLTDCILGSHPDVASFGEMTYLSYKIARAQGQTSDLPPTVLQNSCSCGEDIRECPFWVKTYELIQKRVGIDMLNNPLEFDLAFFNQFSYQDLGGFKRNIFDKAGAYLTRIFIEQGWNYRKLPYLNRKIESWVKNKWLLYESMSEASGKPVIVDSSKHLTNALLLQQYRPEQVTILFIHRSLLGLAASAKKYALKAGSEPNFANVVTAKKRFDNRVLKYKKNAASLNYLEVEYEEVARNPSSFLNRAILHMGLNSNYDKQKNAEFFIDPTQQHIVAGNPMRHKGKQQVALDDRWKTLLSDNERVELNRLFS
jgi:hypothetical protein